jgi:hypothetical protein
MSPGDLHARIINGAFFGPRRPPSPIGLSGGAGDGRAVPVIPEERPAEPSAELTEERVREIVRSEVGRMIAEGTLQRGSGRP